jgi:hypothetical protein
MSTPSVPHAYTPEKPEPPPNVVLSRRLERSCIQRDTLVAANVTRLYRVFEGRE